MIVSKTEQKKTIKDTKVNIDAAAVKELADLFKETDLSEIEYETAGCRIRVARNYGVPQHHQTTFFPPIQSPTILDATPEKQATPIDPSKHPGAIKSPMVGTAYLSSQPGADPFVKVGGPVKEGDTVMIVEAMKVMNPIRAPRSGTVKEIMIQDGTPVEFDEVLLIIE
jgi:acetyl-CoA carboxylase biotin carboxyl carrier protein